MWLTKPDLVTQVSQYYPRCGWPLWISIGQISSATQRLLTRMLSSSRVYSWITTARSAVSPSISWRIWLSHALVTAVCPFAAANRGGIHVFAPRIPEAVRMLWRDRRSRRCGALFLHAVAGG